ncbi:MAG: 1-acyl-sn-glycerol-3-phosphate acyltransferase [Pseudohongiellaceae bacterium]
MDKFKDIRPYLDHEIRPVLDNLINDREFLTSIASFYYPRLTRWLPGIMRRAAHTKLRGQVSGVHDVASMQDVIAGYMDKMIQDTTTRLTHSGLENLQAGRHYLFISNHRDIAMDPAFVNYMLYHAGYSTLQIAIGDNLLKKPFVTDLMRLNKSFIVRRSLKGRDLLRSLMLLSEYIHYCVANDQNVWIAQREGRAKDGIDRTDPALLKMLAMGRRDLPLGESLSALHIVPVAISYEYDPCDRLKAEELYQIASSGSFEKTDDSDIQSIVTGMIGFKGDVHVAFGEELKLDSDEPGSIAAAIDTQVVNNYVLREANFIAVQYLQQKGEVQVAEGSEGDAIRQGIADITADKRAAFEQRLAGIDPLWQTHFLFSYANPVLNRYQPDQKSALS